MTAIPQTQLQPPSRNAMGRRSCVVWLSLAAGMVLVDAHAATHSAVPPGVRQALSAPQLAVQGQMRFWGLKIYDARLWVAPGFDAQHFGRTPLALELLYHRAFSAQAIAQRSVQEIQRQVHIDTAQAQRWEQALAQWLPDVQAGDRLTGGYLPGQGMRLWLGAQPMGRIDDPVLAQWFFGIWLSTQTSQPSLRSDLLSRLSPPAP